MRFKLAFSFFMLLIAGNASGQKKTNKISAYEFRDSSSFMGADKVRVYYYGDLIMYEKEYRFDSTADYLTTDSLVTVYDTTSTDWATIDTSTTTVTSTITDTLHYSDTTTTTIDFFGDSNDHEIRSYYIVHHKDSSFGITYYATEDVQNGDRDPLSSLLSGARPKNSLEQLLEKTPESSLWNSDRTVLVETYRFVENLDTPNIVVKMFYSSKMKDVTESLNRSVDSIKQLKFFRAELEIDSLYNKKNNTTSPSMFFSLELRKIDVPDENEILNYFDRYNAWRRRK